MKKQFYLFAALFAILLVGCKKEQPDLSIGDLSDSAKLTGQVVYSAGIAADSANCTTDVILPATGKKVIVSVPLKAYNATDKSGKSRVFEAVVDAEGKFSITIPCLEEGLDGATLCLEEFSAQRSMGLLKMEDGHPAFVIRMCKFFKDEEVLPRLNPGANIYPGGVIQYEYKIIDMSEYAETAVLVGQLRLPVESAFAVGAYEPAAEVYAEIIVQDAEDIAEGVVKKFTYGVTTDAQGNFKLEVPVKSLKKGFTINDIVVLTKAEKAFKHFNQDGSIVNFAGAYTLRANETSRIHTGYVLSDIVEDIDCNLGAIAMRFIPNYKNDVDDVVVPAGWNENLAGWELGSVDFADYTESVTLYGSVMMAKETAFGVGEYAPAAIEKVELTFSDYPVSKIIVPTDANGNYSIAIPVKAGEKLDNRPSVALVGAEVDDFVHFKDAEGATCMLKGDYKNPQTVRDYKAENTDLGKKYYAFVPNGNNIPSNTETFDENLAGWFVVPFGWEAGDVFEGTIKQPVENGFWDADYKAFANKKIEIKASNIVSRFVVLTDKDGKYSYQSYRSSSQQNVTVSVVLDNNKKPKHCEEKAFVHYYDLANPKSKKIEGTYAISFPTDWKARGANMGITYLAFKPTTTPDDWRDDYYGWMVVKCMEPSAVKKNVTFKLYAQKAMETTDIPHKAAWADAGKQMALVNARNNKDGKYYSLAILSSGKNISFSLPWADEPQAGVSTASAAVSFICSSENNVSFIHYPQTGEAASEKIMGHWSNAYNLSASMTFNNDAFECKNAAKLLFQPETTPEGWSSYNWKAIEGKEIE